MSSKSKETIVMHDLFLVRLLIKFIVAVFCVVAAWMIINQEINVILIVTVLLTLVFPFTWGAVWLRTFKVVMNERTIIVKKYWFKKEISIDDYIKIKYKIVDTNFMHSEKVSIKTKKCKFSVDSNMKNFPVFLDFIKVNLPSEIIEVKNIDNRT
ncbi:MAG: hypothetical protein IJN43_05130 [Ruminococcus sp.]|nr:hypothetical protein [Ruminococcus sp.]